MNRRVLEIGVDGNMHENASISVLRKANFRHTNSMNPPEDSSVQEWEDSVSISL